MFGGRFLELMAWIGAPLPCFLFFINGRWAGQEPAHILEHACKFGSKSPTSILAVHPAHPLPEYYEAKP